jgi:hypothetical protein
MPNINKPCHNCRRRRLRCDRSWPGCHKCAASGQECLGYGQLFVWTEAIDASGNVRKPSAAAAARKASREPAANDDYAVMTLECAAPPKPRSTTTPKPQPQTLLPQVQEQDQEQETQHQEHRQQSAQPATAPLPHNPSLPRPRPHPHPHPHTTSAAIDISPVTIAATAGSLATLTDPLFQDLDRNSRYYLSHFANRVCEDLVARDALGCNPFQELIPLAKRHPLLLEILVATSAMHWSNIFRSASNIPIDLTNAEGYLVQFRSRDLVSRGALIDALAAKQRAMGHLRGVLDTLDPAGSEVVLAAMHFFIKFDLIDMEKADRPSWKTHLEGAFSILSLLSPDVPGNDTHQLLRDCVIADCFIYHIFGSTLAASGGLTARVSRHAFELLPVMKRAEMNGHLSCPPEILQIILVASQLSCDAPCTDWSLTAADEALALIDQAIAFDIPAWASRLPRNDMVDIESRVHVASAHRSAACLYILQALPFVRAVRPVDSDFLVSDILSHLSMVDENNWFFKASSWPVFIAGAETRDSEKRMWCLRRLLAIWETCPWGYIFTAIEMLKATWEMQDAGGSSGEVEVNWLRDLKGLGFEYLIV